MSNPLPAYLAEFDKHRSAFEAWLIEHGSAVKRATNEYEVIRFTGTLADCIVYRKSGGRITSWINGADKAFQAFLDKSAWRPVEKGKRTAKSTNLILSLAKRDGWRCCYCPTELSLESATVEHFVPITSGGSSHLANLSLACDPCNQEAGHMPVRAKIEMAVRKRAARVET